MNTLVVTIDRLPGFETMNGFPLMNGQKLLGRFVDEDSNRVYYDMGTHTTLTEIQTMFLNDNTNVIWYNVNENNGFMFCVVLTIQRDEVVSTIADYPFRNYEYIFKSIEYDKYDKVFITSLVYHDISPEQEQYILNTPYIVDFDINPTSI